MRKKLKNSLTCRCSPRSKMHGNNPTVNRTTSREEGGGGRKGEQSDQGLNSYSV